MHSSGAILDTDAESVRQGGTVVGTLMRPREQLPSG